jgi:hypothetical protein
LTDAFASNNVKEDFDQVDPKHIMDVLKNLSAMPHLAGDARDLVLADYIKDQWIEYGLDHVEVDYYARPFIKFISFRKSYSLADKKLCCFA